jgi:hypothetical protein
VSILRHISSGEFLATEPEVHVSIPGAARFSEKQWVCNGVHSAFERLTEELTE